MGLFEMLFVARDVFSTQHQHDDARDGSYQGEKRQYDNENNVARDP